MRQREHNKRKEDDVSCPLCGHTDVHYRKETDTWVCGHCDYGWYTIEHGTNHRNRET